jgi:cytochrome c oxidase cbb3-type subunit 4
MMDWLVSIYPTLRALWVVWFFLLFVGMVVWVMRPSKKKDFERAGEIPFRDDGKGPRAQGGATGHGSL